MMNKSRSAKLHLVKFLFIVPLLGVLLVAFRDKIAMDEASGIKVNAGLPASVVNDVSAESVVTDTTRPPGKIVQVLKLDGAKPMIVLDEEESAKEKVDKLDPNDIATVNVLKHALEFGPRGTNGVVLVYRKNYVSTGIITLKDGTKVKLVQRAPVAVNPPGAVSSVGEPGKEELGVIVQDTINLGAPVKEEDAPKQDLRDCLFILDGKVSSYEEVFNLPPAKIASINILKDKSAVAIYGSRAKSGVVLVATKAAGFKGQPTITSIEKGDTITVRSDTIQLRVHEKEN